MKSLLATGLKGIVGQSLLFPFYFLLKFVALELHKAFLNVLRCSFQAKQEPSTLMEHCFIYNCRVCLFQLLLFYNLSLMSNRVQSVSNGVVYKFVNRGWGWVGVVYKSSETVMLPTASNAAGTASRN